MTAPADSAQYRPEFTLAGVGSDEVMWMPGGVQTINPMREGSKGPLQVLVDYAASQAIEGQRELLAARGNVIYFDFDHKDGARAFTVSSFIWKDGSAPGIYARGKWSAEGVQGVEGGEWRSFSPVFWAEPQMHGPLKIVGRMDASPNMGGLTNNPAFTTIAPVKTKQAIVTLTSGPLYASQNSDSNQPNQTSNPQNKMSLNPARKPQVAIVQESAAALLGEYAAILARNVAIKNPSDPQKLVLAREAGAIFCGEMRRREDEWGDCPLDHALKASDVTSPAVGTLAGTLTLQRNLPLLRFNFPMLQTLFSDFSDSPGQWMQTEMTRIPISPAVSEYDGTLDTNGRPKGFVLVTPAQSVDVPITLNKHVGIAMIFGVQTLVSTIRNLFAEQAAGALNALGGYFVDMATALMTPANFNAYKQITDASCGTTSGSTAITLATTAGVYKGQEISGTGIPTGAHIASVTDGTNAVMTMAATATATVTATLGGGRVPTLYPTYVKAQADFNFASLGEIGAAFDQNKVPYGDRAVMLNANYYQRLAQDPTFNTFFATVQSPDIIRRGELPMLNNFVPQKAPWFPASNNRVGLAYHKAAIALKSRLPKDFSSAVNAMVPGNVIPVTDPDTGLSVLLVERVDLVGSYAESRVEVMLGAALGDPRAGMVITSA